MSEAITKALQDKAVEVRIPAAGPSTFEQRFAEAVRLLTHASPPADMVASWLDHTSEDLQHWIGSQKGTPEWAQSLAITDAAHTMAISPVEGEQHDFEPPGAPPPRWCLMMWRAIEPFAMAWSTSSHMSQARFTWLVKLAFTRKAATSLMQPSTQSPPPSRMEGQRASLAAWHLRYCCAVSTA